MRRVFKATKLYFIVQLNFSFYYSELYSNNKSKTKYLLN